MDLRKLIDNTLLKPFATPAEVESFVRRSLQIGFYAVCVNPYHVRIASEVANCRIKVCSVVGFPLGLSKKETKIQEAVRAVRDGADELDVVMNISEFKARNYGYVEEEIKALKRETGVLLKVILETCYLTEEEKETAVKLCIEAGADFVKTSTGFGDGGATVEDVRFLKRVAEGRIKVKASGGIRDLKTALAMVEAGADRIGTSSGFRIYEEAKGR